MQQGAYITQIEQKTLNCNNEATYLIQAWINLIHDTRFFRGTTLFVSPSGCVKNGRTKPRCASDRERTGDIAFCSLLPK